MSAQIRGEFYSSFSEIREELKKRKNDPTLRQRVLEYLGDDFPDFLDKGDAKAVFIRTIHTPNQEHFFFRDLAEEFELDTVFCNYVSGKLVMKNSEKYHLVKMGFFDGINKKGALMHHYKNIVNVNKNEGKSLKDVVTENGVGLEDFHISLLKALGYNEEFPDISEWFNKIRLDKDGYYAKFMALFVCHGVLFDNYLITDETEKQFFAEKVWPAFNFIKEKFGLKPLVFPVLPIKEENNSLFFFYNSNIQGIIKDKYDI